MTDPSKTNQELIEEISVLKQKNKELEHSESERKRAEEALQASNELFSLFIRHSPIYTYIKEVTSTQNLVLQASDNFGQMIGITGSEMAGKTMTELFPPELAEKITVDDWAVVSGGNVLRLDEELNGRSYTTIKFPIVLGNKTLLAGYTIDITERRKAENALRESEERFRRLANATWEGIIIHREGNIMDANESASKILGYPVEEIIGKNIIAFIAPESIEPTMRKLREGTTHDQLYLELKVLRKDKTIFPAEALGRPIRYNNIDARVLAFRDISDRKQAEEALRETEDKIAKSYESLSSILDSLDSLVYVADFYSYEILFINKYGRERFGDVRGRICWQSIQKDQNGPCSFCTNDRMLSDSGIPTGVYRWEFQNTNNGRWYECRDQAISWIGKSLVRMEIATDITERKQIEEEKQKLEEQNRQFQKAESLGRMAGAIAHTFNNQLGAVIGNLEMVLMDLPQGAGHFDSLTAAMQAANKAAEVSGQMLTYLGQSFDKRELMDLAGVCLKNLPIIQSSLPGKVALETDLPTPGPTISANANQTQQVLTNLITNAWEAVGEDGGSIHLRVKEVSLTEIPIVHRNPIDWQPQDNAYACLEVTDTGCGIADKDIEKIFDPFFSSKFTGRGMGLAIVMGIVRAHGGVVTIESEPGQGSTFRIFFPVSVEEVLRQHDKAAQPSATEGGGTVLLVEDDEMVRNMAAAMLKRLGFTVLEAKDGVEAVEIFRERKDEIRCVITDLTMPRMNGWETLTALRKLAPDIPVILASGYDKAQVMAGDHPELPQVFLGKPYKLKGLSDAISQALVRRNSTV